MPRKGENIYKRKDGRWEGRYIKSRTSDGKSIYGYVYAKTYRDVKKKLHAAAYSIKTTIVPNTDLESFEGVAMEWFENIKLQTKESTSNKYWNLLNSYILPVYAEQLLRDISCDFIENYCNTLLVSGGSKKAGLSPKTVSDILSVIRNILKFAIKRGKYVPCDGRGIQIKQASKEMRVLSKSEQENLCQYLKSEPNSCNIGILICLFTGLRVGEVCALRWEDVSFPEQTIRIHQTLQRVQDRVGTEKRTKLVVTAPKSACSIRTIPVPTTLISILSEYKTSSKGYLLTNSESVLIEPRTMQNHFKIALDKSGVAPANFHALRHTFATRCVELGFDVKSLSEILGHATVNITMNRYVHPSLDLKKENMQRLSSLLTVS